MSRGAVLHFLSLNGASCDTTVYYSLPSRHESSEMCQRCKGTDIAVVPTQTQPYYIPDCNAGNSDASHCESEWMAANGRSQNEECAADADTLKSAAQRIAYARSLGPEEFSALLARIQLAYDQARTRLHMFPFAQLFTVKEAAL